MGRIGRLLAGYLVIVLLACWPILSVAIASAVSWAGGCTVHEGFKTPCVVAGADIGGVLYKMTVMGWLMLATIPLGLLALAAWTIVWAVWVRRRSGGRKSSHTPEPA